MRKFFMIILFLLIIPSLQFSNAVPSIQIVSGDSPSILITLSGNIQDAIIDGIWTNKAEWKQSSWDIITTQGMEAIHLRSAHQGDFIYILLDVVADNTFDNISDKALVCIDSKNDKTNIPGDDDYCFHASYNGQEGFVSQGGSPLALNGYFEKILNTEGFVGVGGKSNQYDKHSKIPHTSYEFKIPLELFGRSDVYGFYVQVFDASTSQYYTWPQNVIPSSPFDIPSPSKWGLLVSPDKSIPEFELPLLALIPAIFLVIYLTRNRSNRFENNKNVFTKAKKSFIGK